MKTYLIKFFQTVMMLLFLASCGSDDDEYHEVKTKIRFHNLSETTLNGVTLKGLNSEGEDSTLHYDFLEISWDETTDIHLDGESQSDFGPSCGFEWSIRMRDLIFYIGDSIDILVECEKILKCEIDEDSTLMCFYPDEP